MKEWLRQGTMIRAISFKGGAPASKVSLERDWEKRVNNTKKRLKSRDTYLWGPALHVFCYFGKTRGEVTGSEC